MAYNNNNQRPLLQDNALRQQRHNGDFPMHVVVVESHQHVLEHIHTVLRRQRRYRKRRPHQQSQDDKVASSSWSMVHFDAHPDLACPGTHIPAVACFTPRREFGYQLQKEATDYNQKKNLYELLDSTASGIAEWIVPLVLAADLRMVHWIRPEGSIQLPLGYCDFHVGAWNNSTSKKKKDNADIDASSSSVTMSTAKSFLDIPDTAIIKVDLQHPYYIEDSCVVRTDELLLPQPLHLNISELPNHPQKEISGWRKKQHDNKTVEHDANKTQNGPNHQKYSLFPSSSVWALDICLDTFACLNPFLVDIEKINPRFTQSLVEVFTSTRFHKTQATTFSSLYSNGGATTKNNKNKTTIETDTTSYSKERILQHSTNDEDNYDDNDSFKTYEKEYFGFIDRLSKFLYAVAKSHDNESDHSSLSFSPEYLELLTYYESKEVANNILQTMIRRLRETDKDDNRYETLLSMTIEALPNLKLPHFPTMSATASTCGKEEIVREKMHGRIQACMEQIYKISSDCAPEFGCYGQPFVITIARSAEDGFTPDFLVEEAQNMILTELHAMFCGCDALSLLSKTSDNANHNITPSHFQDSNNCSWNLIFDYGEWEGSSFE